MPFLLDFTMLTVLQKNVIQDIIAEAEPPIKPLVRPDSTPPKKDPLPALNAHPERMLTLSVPKPAKIVILIPTNRHPMRRNAFQCKQGITNPVQQPKSNARRVKQEAVAMLRVTIVKLGCINIFPVTPRALNAPVDLATMRNVRQHAMRYLQVRTVGTVHFEDVFPVISAKVKPPIKPLAHPDSTPPKQDPLHALNVRPERTPTLSVPKPAKIATLIPTNQNPMQRNAF